MATQIFCIVTPNYLGFNDSQFWRMRRIFQMVWLKPPASWWLLLCKMETFSGWRRVPHRAWRFSGSFLSRDRDFLGWWIRNKWTPFFKATKSWPPTAGIQKKSHTARPPVRSGAVHQDQVRGVPKEQRCVCVRHRKISFDCTDYTDFRTKIPWEWKEKCIWRCIFLLKYLAISRLPR